jgi:hypothetical protein
LMRALAIALAARIIEPGAWTWREIAFGRLSPGALDGPTAALPDPR